MNIGTLDEARSWFGNKSCQMPADCSVTVLDSLATVEVSVPKEYSRVIVLNDCLLSFENPPVFSGGILIVDNFEIWSEVATIGLFDKLRSSMAGRLCELENAPVSIFSAS